MSKSTYQKRNGHERYKFMKKNSNGYMKARRKVALVNLTKKMLAIEELNKSSEEPIDLNKDHNYQRIKKEITNIEQKN
jgi:hypothetical protein